MQKILTLLSVILLNLTVSTYAEERKSINLYDRDRSKKSVNLYERNQKAFRDNFHIRLYDMSKEDSLKSVTLYGPRDEQIQFKTSFSSANRKFILGTTMADTRLTISTVKEVDDRVQITFTARDKSGASLSALDRDSIALYDGNGNRMCVTLSEIRNSQTIVVVGILVDISWSMGSYAGTLNRAVSKFINELPSNAYCNVMDFNTISIPRYTDIQCNRIGSYTITPISIRRKLIYKFRYRSV